MLESSDFPDYIHKLNPTEKVVFDNLLVAASLDSDSLNATTSISDVEKKLRSAVVKSLWNIKRYSERRQVICIIRLIKIVANVCIDIVDDRVFEELFNTAPVISKTFTLYKKMSQWIPYKRLPLHLYQKGIHSTLNLNLIMYISVYLDHVQKEDKVKINGLMLEALKSYMEASNKRKASEIIVFKLWFESFEVIEKPLLDIIVRYLARDPSVAFKVLRCILTHASKLHFNDLSIYKRLDFFENNLPNTEDYTVLRVLVEFVKKSVHPEEILQLIGSTLNKLLRSKNREIENLLRAYYMVSYDIDNELLKKNMLRTLSTSPYWATLGFTATEANSCNKHAAAFYAVRYLEVLGFCKETLVIVKNGISQLCSQDMTCANQWAINFVVVVKYTPNLEMVSLVTDAIKKLFHEKSHHKNKTLLNLCCLFLFELHHRDNKATDWTEFSDIFSYIHFSSIEELYENTPEDVCIQLALIISLLSLPEAILRRISKSYANFCRSSTKKILALNTNREEFDHSCMFEGIQVLNHALEYQRIYLKNIFIEPQVPHEKMKHFVHTSIVSNPIRAILRLSKIPVAPCVISSLGLLNLNHIWEMNIDVPVYNYIIYSAYVYCSNQIFLRWLLKFDFLKQLPQESLQSLHMLNYKLKTSISLTELKLNKNSLINLYENIPPNNLIPPNLLRLTAEIDFDGDSDTIDFVANTVFDHFFQRTLHLKNFLHDTYENTFRPKKDDEWYEEDSKIEFSMLEAEAKDMEVLKNTLDALADLVDYMCLTVHMVDRLKSFIIIHMQYSKTAPLMHTIMTQLLRHLPNSRDRAGISNLYQYLALHPNEPIPVIPEGFLEEVQVQPNDAIIEILIEIIDAAPLNYYLIAYMHLHRNSVDKIKEPTKKRYLASRLKYLRRNLLIQSVESLNLTEFAKEKFQYMLEELLQSVVQYVDVESVENFYYLALHKNVYLRTWAYKTFHCQSDDILNSHNIIKSIIFIGTFDDDLIIKDLAEKSKRFDEINSDILNYIVHELHAECLPSVEKALIHVFDNGLTKHYNGDLLYTIFGLFDNQIKIDAKYKKFGKSDDTRPSISNVLNILNNLIFKIEVFDDNLVKYYIKLLFRSVSTDQVELDLSIRLLIYIINHSDFGTKSCYIESLKEFGATMTCRNQAIFVQETIAYMLKKFDIEDTSCLKPLVDVFLARCYGYADHNWSTIQLTADLIRFCYTQPYGEDASLALKNEAAPFHPQLNIDTLLNLSGEAFSQSDHRYEHVTSFIIRVFPRLPDLLKKHLKSVNEQAELKDERSIVFAICCGYGLESFMCDQVKTLIILNLLSTKNSSNINDIKNAYRYLTGLLQTFENSLTPEYAIAIINTLIHIGFNDKVNWTLNLLENFSPLNQLKIINYIRTEITNYTNWKIRHYGVFNVISAEVLMNCDLVILENILCILCDYIHDMHPKIIEYTKKYLKIIIIDRLPSDFFYDLNKSIWTALTSPTETNVVQFIESAGKAQFRHYIHSCSLLLFMKCIKSSLLCRISSVKKNAAALLCVICVITRQKKVFFKHFDIVKHAVQENLFHSSPEIRNLISCIYRIIVYTFGEDHLDLDWLFQKLISTITTERMGAANALAQIYAALGTEKLEKVLPKILENIKHNEFNIRDGYLGLLVFLPSAFKDSFEKFVPRVLPVLLRAMSLEHESQRDVAYKAAENMVSKYGASHTALLLAPLEDAIFHVKSDITISAINLLGALAQHASSSDVEVSEISSLERFSFILCSLYTIRFSDDITVKRQATTIWKNIVHNTPKTLKRIMPILLKRLCSNLTSSNEQKQKISINCLEAIALKFPNEVAQSVMPTLCDMLNQSENLAHGAIGLSIILPHINQSTLNSSLNKIVTSLEPALRSSNETQRIAAANCIAKLDFCHSVLIPQLLSRFFLFQDLNETQNYIESLKIIFESCPSIGQHILKIFENPLSIVGISCIRVFSVIKKYSTFNTYFNNLLPVIYNYGVQSIKDFKTSPHLFEELKISLDQLALRFSNFEGNYTEILSNLESLIEITVHNDDSRIETRYRQVLVLYILEKFYKFSNKASINMNHEFIDLLPAAYDVCEPQIFREQLIKTFTQYLTALQESDKTFKFIIPLEKIIKCVYQCTKSSVHGQELIGNLFELCVTRLQNDAADTFDSFYCFSILRQLITFAPYDSVTPHIFQVIGIMFRLINMKKFQLNDKTPVILCAFERIYEPLKPFLVQFYIFLVHRLFTSDDKSISKSFKNMCGVPSTALNSAFVDISLRLPLLKEININYLLNIFIDIFDTQKPEVAEEPSKMFLKALNSLYTFDDSMESDILLARCFAKAVSIRSISDQNSFFDDYLCKQLTEKTNEAKICAYILSQVFSCANFWIHSSNFYWVQLCLTILIENDTLSDLTLLVLSQLNLCLKFPEFQKVSTELFSHYRRLLCTCNNKFILVQAFEGLLLYYTSNNNQSNNEQDLEILNLCLYGLSSDSEDVNLKTYKLLYYVLDVDKKNKKVDKFQNQIDSNDFKKLKDFTSNYKTYINSSC